MKKTICFALALAVLLGMMSGCTMESAENLYQLPKLPAAYDQLQEALQTVLDQGAEYVAPSSGMSRQPVQMADLDGDGTQEAVALFRVSEEERPIRAYIFKELDGAYRTIGLIQEEGMSVESLSFVDMDGTGQQEILLGLSVGQGALKILALYSMTSGDPVCVLKSRYSTFACYDLDADGTQEVLLAKYDATEKTGQVECYRYRPQGMGNPVTVALSGPIAGVVRLSTGHLLNEVPALFVTSSLEEGGTVTDILACRYGQMMSLTPPKETEPEEEPGLAEEKMGGLVLPDDLIHGTDLNKDGVFDLPRYRSLGGTGEENYQVIDWYNYDLEGEATLALTTYHSVTAGWYLEIPPQWDDGNLGIRRSEAQKDGSTRGLTFFHRESGGETDLLTVYLLSGSGRNKVAERPGRFIVYEMAESILAAELGTQVPEKLAITWEEVLERMHLIETDWLTGEAG